MNDAPHIPAATQQQQARLISLIRSVLAETSFDHTCVGFKFSSTYSTVDADLDIEALEKMQIWMVDRVYDSQEHADKVLYGRLHLICSKGIRLVYGDNVKQTDFSDLSTGEEHG